MSTTLDGDAVQQIADLAQEAQSADARLTRLDGRTFSTTPLHEVRPKLFTPAALVVHTLTGFADYLTTNRDGLDLSQLVVHVAGPSEVRLVSPLEDEEQRRHIYLQAEALNRFAAQPTFGFGRWMDAEEMLIAVQVLFEDEYHRAEVLRLLGNVRDEEIRNRVDDGVSQQVTVKSGLGGLVDRVDVPNPVTLAPFRTFAEIPQPASAFVIRMKKGPSGVTAALFEADGGAWRLGAINAAAAWLRERLPAELAVIA